MPLIIDISGFGDGTYTIEDDGVAGNGTSVLRDPQGNIVTTFAHPADALTILSRAGQSLNVNFTDSLVNANFTVGSLTDASVNPDSISVGALATSGVVTLAAREAVTELGSDSGADIIAGTLLIDAGTGIGIGNAIETQTLILEAESAAGGVALSNVGNLQIGGPTPNLRGVFTDTNGDIVLTNQGSILLADNTGLETLRSAGNLTLFASGAAADITSTISTDALLAVGNMVLVAERDVSFGTFGANFDNDVRAGGGITIQAGRDFTIDGFADLAADDQGLASGGGVNITAGRNISIEDVTGTDASVGVSGTGGGSVVLTTGIGGTMSLAAGSSATVFSGIGGVFLNADRLLIEADSGVTATGGGAVTIATASTGRAINLGSSADGVVALEISDAELDRVFATSVIVGNDTSGDVRVLGDLTTSFANFEIRSGSDILVLSGIAATSLTLRADDDVSQLVGSAITAGVVNVFVDQDGDADAEGGVGTLGGVTSGAANLTGNVDDDTLTGNASVNTLDGGAGDDDLNGGAGNDVLIGGLGTDALDGGAGDDDLNAGDGNDVLISGLGTDTLDGGAGDDDLNGGAGDDVLIGGLGTDALDGGADFDVASYGNTTAGLTARLADATLNTGEAAGDTYTSIEGLAGSAFKDTLVGDGGANGLRGAAGNDRLEGLDGDDAIQGDAGKDRLFGGVGVDTLNGGEGADRLIGGTEADTFVFASIADSGIMAKTRDTIVDFKRSETDKIDLQGIDAIASTGGDDAFTFIGKAAFNDVEGELRYQKKGGDTFIYGDVDGDGKADFSILVDASLSMKVADFNL